MILPKTKIEEEKIEKDNNLYTTKFYVQTKEIKYRKEALEFLNKIKPYNVFGKVKGYINEEGVHFKDNLDENNLESKIVISEYEQKLRKLKEHQSKTLTTEEKRKKMMGDTNSSQLRFGIRFQEINLMIDFVNSSKSEIEVLEKEAKLKWEKFIESKFEILKDRLSFEEQFKDYRSSKDFLNSDSQNFRNNLRIRCYPNLVRNKMTNRLNGISYINFDNIVERNVLMEILENVTYNKFLLSMEPIDPIP